MANLNIEQKNVRTVFQEAKYMYLIPDYQRPYEWGEEECKRLWDDVYLFAFPGDNWEKFDDNDEYFLGPIVTFKNSDNNMEIIDGQQRLTTLLLLLRSCYNRLLEQVDDKSRKMCDEIVRCLLKTNSFGEYTGNTPLRLDSWVATDEDKDELFSILRYGKDLGKKSRYARNFAFFNEKVNEFINKYPGYFAYLPNRLLNNCVLLPIEADKQETALRIFSTLNDRGKPLSDTDIFKAQLFKHYVSIGKKTEFVERWKRLEEIAREAFRSPTTIPLDELFTRYMYYERALKGNRNTTIEGLRRFYEGSDNYGLLRKEGVMDNLLSLALFWESVARQDKAQFTERALRRLFVLNHAPNGMWTYVTSVYFMKNRDAEGNLDDAPFARFLDRIIAFVWAYSITNPGMGSLRNPLFSEMTNIVEGKEVTFSDFRLDEETLRTSISVYRFVNGRPITKSMLAWWMMYQSGQGLPSTDTNLAIEHIYAVNRQDKEQGLSDISHLNCLGNKALLESRVNIRASDYRFVDKKRYYLGYITANGQKKDGTDNVELQNMAKIQDDFTEREIMARDAKMVNSFITYLRANDLIKDVPSRGENFVAEETAMPVGDICQCPPSHVSENPEKHVFYLKRWGSDARGTYDKARRIFTLLAGSVLSNWKNSDVYYRERQEEFIRKHCEVRDGQIVLLHDVELKSPSGAATIVLVRASNGWEAWRDADGRSLDEAGYRY